MWNCNVTKMRLLCRQERGAKEEARERERNLERNWGFEEGRKARTVDSDACEMV